VDKREKVIKGLECCSVPSDKRDCDLCPIGFGEGCALKLKRDAASLLKAQEPRLVHVTADINHRKIGECPNCGKGINSGDYSNYCGRCGQAVKWE
jgi:endogenous inhibitor of DNA gyrase (YacG/DUF329 family)